MAAASVTGLVAPGVYRDNALVTAGWRGNDLITLFVAAPLLGVAVWRSSRASQPWRLGLLGLLLYALYGYAFYLFGAAFNALFLVYVAIVAASAFGLVFGLGALDVDRVAAGFRPGAPVRAVAGYTMVVGVLLGGFWMALSIAYVFTGDPPAMVAATGHPTNITGALDLSMVVTLAVLSGMWLWRRQPWGYVLAVVWNVKGAAYMLALSAASVAAYREGAAPDVAQVALWGPIGLGCLFATAAMLYRYGAAGIGEPDATSGRARLTSEATADPRAHMEWWERQFESTGSS